ncbi:MAG: hypothetical protein K2Q33_08725 [Gammaproteobacteria bacterium]|nr:hypothetical protein [Gammaproteobacteria bacterium]
MFIFVYNHFSIILKWKVKDMAMHSIVVSSIGSLLQNGYPEEKADALVQFFQDKFDIVVKAPWLSETELPNEEKAVSTKDAVSLGCKIPSTNHLKDGDSIEFIGGSLVKLTSNQGNHWFAIIDEDETARNGAQKSVHRIQRIIAITKTGVIKDKWHVSGKYVLVLYFQKGLNVDNLQKEVAQNKEFDSSTKPLTLFKSDSGAEDQYGFVMRNYGKDLTETHSDNSIVPLIAEKAKELLGKRKTHLDLKLENMCYHPEYRYKDKNKKNLKTVNFIDLEGIKSIDELIEEECLHMTEDYLHPFFKKEENKLLLGYGQYRIAQYLYALTFSCYQFMAYKPADDADFLKSIEQNELIIKIGEFIHWLEESKDKLTQPDLVEESFKYGQNFIDLLEKDLKDSCENRVEKEETQSFDYSDLEDSPSSLSSSSDVTKTESPILPFSPLSCEGQMTEKRSLSEGGGNRKRKAYEFWQLPNEEQGINVLSSKRMCYSLQL